MLELFQMQTFLPLPYEAALAPRLKRAQDRLQTGWDWMEDRTGRVQAAATRIRARSQALVVAGLQEAGIRGIIDCLISPYYNLKARETPRIFFVGGSLSSDALREVLELVDGVDFSVCVSSAAAGPAAAFRIFRAVLEDRYGPEGARQRIYAATEAGSPLQVQADEAGWEAFPGAPGAEGPHGLLGAGGLLPMAALGVDIGALLSGAAEMAALCRADSFENPAWRYAAVRHQLYRSGRSVEVLAAYDPSLRFLLEWWRQLLALSEGKEGKALFPAAALYTGDLHTLGQYLQEGKRLMFETVIRLGSAGGPLEVPGNGGAGDLLGGKSMDLLQGKAMEAALLAHTQGGVPNIILNAGEKTPAALGGLIYFLQYACGLSARLLDVDPLARSGEEVYKAQLASLLREEHLVQAPAAASFSWGAV